jgi:hypothetical protein
MLSFFGLVPRVTAAGTFEASDKLETKPVESLMKVRLSSDVGRESVELDISAQPPF